MNWIEKQMLRMNLWSMMKKLSSATDTLDDTELAQILILAQYYYKMLLKDWNMQLRIIDNPIGCDEKTIFSLIIYLLDTMVVQKERFKLLEAIYNGAPEEYMEYLKYYRDKCRWSIELWICTLGVGIFTNNIEKMRKIWQALQKPRTCLDSAFKELQQINHIFSPDKNRSVEANALCFINLKNTEAKKLCRFVPKLFMK